ncbi:hypothetical protein EXIGLDRAFT_837531 [Exidia glandulosa HHB12029]|uniref:DUF6697 domain-containing protein n=1 Tax=Exidia glandulosa HHB12029 TaxID=1314781 RepID=A0A165GQQ5_EXIGL|nr:hypothetical protein EXIGLDRAFT_837531 [Exidia glandulosa HHB12029]
MSVGRRIFDCVELPPPPADKARYVSLSPVKVKREHEDDDVVLLHETPAPKKPKVEDAVKVKIEETAEELKFKERKVKIEPSAVVLSEEGVRRRLDKYSRKPLVTTLTEAERNHTFSRQLFTDHFERGHNVYTFFRSRGGSLGDAFWTRFMCPNRSMNPYAPRVPGENGLFLNSDVTEDQESDIETDNDSDSASDSNSVVVTGETRAVDDKKSEEKKRPTAFERCTSVLAHIAPGHWRYVGHYASYPAESLTVEEWKQQSSSFKNALITEAFNRKQCYKMRWRVWQRKRMRTRLGRDPTKAEVREAIEPLTDRDLPGLTMKDIEKAFENGELCVKVEALCFVAYHEEFQREMIEISANPRPRPKKAKPRARPKAKPKVKVEVKAKAKVKVEDKAKAKKEGATVAVGQKRKRAGSDDSYSDDGSD